MRRLGNTSVAYDIGLFHVGDEMPAAVGYLVHVYVDRVSGESISVPNVVRGGLNQIT